MDGKTLGAMPVHGLHGAGITLRQHFASQIFSTMMQGAVLPPGFDAEDQLLFAAKRACEAADCLLIELAKEQQG